MGELPDKPATETDPRFPSGPWKGFWLEAHFGKQHMQLSLAFADGRITGSGSDIVGKFVFDGTYDLKSGHCLLTKTYLGRHQVQYEGINEGEGLWLWGLWHIRHMKDGFHLWPAGEEDPTQRHLGAHAELPTPRLMKGELLEIGALDE